MHINFKFSDYYHLYQGIFSKYYIINIDYNRLSDLMQRESQMTNPVDRQQTQRLAHEIGY